jgi:hypothetical protein
VTQISAEQIGGALSKLAIQGAIQRLAVLDVDYDDVDGHDISERIRALLTERWPAMLADIQRALDPFGLGADRAFTPWAKFSLIADAQLIGAEAVDAYLREHPIQSVHSS